MAKRTPPGAFGSLGLSRPIGPVRGRVLLIGLIGNGFVGIGLLPRILIVLPTGNCLVIIPAIWSCMALSRLF